MTLNELRYITAVARERHFGRAADSCFVSQPIGPYLLPHLIPRVMELAPDMPLVIEENYTAVLTERLKGGDLDVIIISLPFEETGISIRHLYAEDLVILLSGTHPLCSQSEITVDRLAEENVLLLGPGHCFRDQALHWLGASLFHGQP